MSKALEISQKTAQTSKMTEFHVQWIATVRNHQVRGLNDTGETKNLLNKSALSTIFVIVTIEVSKAISNVGLIQPYGGKLTMSSHHLILLKGL